MRDHARAKAAAALERLAQTLERAHAVADPASIHGLRVSIRRLLVCLRVFRAFYPRRARKRIAARLDPLMRAAGGVRDRDVALELLAAAGVSAASPAARRLATERAALMAALAASAAALAARGVERKWRAALEL